LISQHNVDAGVHRLNKSPEMVHSYISFHFFC
jgi:hypothetical protein